MARIGIEEHYLTAAVRGTWEAIGLAAMDPSVGIHSGEIERRLLDLTGERIALMDQAGLDVQVLSLTTPGLHDLGPESVDLARRANDSVAEAIVRWPDRLQALATLPVAMPEEAALELERCIRTLGFKGTMLSGRVGDRNLDHSDLFPIFQSADTLKVPVLLHPARRPRRCGPLTTQASRQKSMPHSPCSAWDGTTMPAFCSFALCLRERSTVCPAFR